MPMYLLKEASVMTNRLTLGILMGTLISIPFWIAAIGWYRFIRSFF